MRTFFVTLPMFCTFLFLAEGARAGMYLSCANHTIEMLSRQMRKATSNVEKQKVTERKEELLTAIRSVVKVTVNSKEKDSQTFNGTATYLGNGWFITSAHIVDRKFEVILRAQPAPSNSLKQFKINGEIYLVEESGAVVLDSVVKDQIQRTQGYESNNGSWVKTLNDVNIRLNNDQNIHSSEVDIFRPIPNYGQVSNVQPINEEAEYGYLIPGPDLALLKIPMDKLSGDSRALLSNLQAENILSTSLKVNDWVEAVPWGNSLVRFPIEEFNGDRGAWSFPKPVYEWRRCPSDFMAESIFKDRFSHKVEVVFGVPSIRTMSGSPVFGSDSNNQLGIVGVTSMSGEVELVTTVESSSGERSDIGIFSYFVSTNPMNDWITSLISKH